MDNFGEQKTDLLSSNFIEVDDYSSQNLRSAATWAKTIAIIGAVFCVLLLCLVLTFGAGFSQLSAFLSESFTIIWIILAVVIAVFVLLIINLFRFSSGVAEGVSQQDAIALDRGMDGLKIFFIITGVLSMLYIFIYLINIVSAL